MPVRVSVELPASAEPTPQILERFQREKRLYKGWIYLLPRATFTPLLLTRDELIKASADNGQTEFEEFPDDEEPK